MTDRIPTQILENGAIRYAEYDSSGNFVQYRYLLPADEPTQVGTPINKANLLSDTTAAALASAIGMTLPTTVNEALNGLAVKPLKAATVSYTGTGTHGLNNPTSVTLDFRPVLMWVFTSYQGRLFASFQNGRQSPVIPTSLLTTDFVRTDAPQNDWSSSRGYTYCKKSADGKTITWYTDYDADAQLNAAGNVYIVFFIG